MTEKLHSLSTHTVTPSQTTVLSPKCSPALLDHVSSKVETVDEEPYTIKCICNFSDDDGNTIYCETCDTWQHIECFYPHNIQDAYREDFAHSCADCKPRQLDRQRAVERQRLRRSKIDTEETPERKPKRPPAKSHKKKTKPTDLQLNGHSGSDSNSKPTHDQLHSHKKSKSTHRVTHSISSHPPKRSPSYGQKNGNPHGHPPSPATTPPDALADEIHNYSSGFLTLYNDDRDVHIVETNSFASLTTSNDMILWLRDHDKLRRDTGKEYNDVFQRLPADIHSLKRTPIIESKKHLMDANTVLQWQFLKAPHAIEKDIPLVELNGQVGFQKDYCDNPDNRWADLSSPLPFVFFHPTLPLYIDTRREGSLARYVRRSCRPNATLETYLSGGAEYHFWLVSSRRIAPNEQITISWDFGIKGAEGSRMLQLINLGDDEANGSQPDFDPNEVGFYQYIAGWLHSILSEYGGCACDLGTDCAFARFHQKYISRQSKSNPNKRRQRKPKTHTISPTSTGHATNSRAPSEGHGDDDSGSSRSKPPSRDMTPARQGSFDTLGILTEPTDRDKRKIALVEDSFRRLEQQQPPRKKKRSSDGAGGSGTSRTKSRISSSRTPGLPNGTSERRYVDAGTNRSMSRSPVSAISPRSTHPFKQSGSRHDSIPIPSRHSSEGPRPEYVDASVQTDTVDGEWFSPAHHTPKPKKRVVSLSKRLLSSRHRLRSDEEDRRRITTDSPTAVTFAMVKMGLDSPSMVEQTNGPTSPGAVIEKVAPPAVMDNTDDIVMTDAPSASPTEAKNNSPTTTSSVTVKIKSPDLRVQMPPVPIFNATTSASTSSTPLSATASLAQSPLIAGNLPSPFGLPSINGVVAQPSPVKKKLSLSDYTKSRMNKAAAAAAKPVGASLKPPTTIMEEAKSPSTTTIAGPDTPMTDKPADP